MRTTITLEADVEALIRTVMKERGVSFKQALNSSVRAGLTQTRHRKRHFVQKSFSLGSERNFRWDKALATADAIDDEELTSDAHLAALALEHGAELCSTDADFARFPRLRWRNPLV